MQFMLGEWSESYCFSVGRIVSINLAGFQNEVSALMTDMALSNKVGVDKAHTVRLDFRLIP